MRIPKTLVLIRVSKVLDYKTLSRRSDPNSAAKARLIKIAYICKNFDTTPMKVFENFGYYLATIIRLKVQEAVKEQKIQSYSMKTLYKPLSESYNKSKPKDTQDKFWICTDYLIKHLKVWKKKNEIYIGYMEKDTYPQSKTSPLLVLFWVEKGTKNMPARPLFFPLVKWISKNVDDYFTRFYNVILSGEYKIQP